MSGKSGTHRWGRYSVTIAEDGSIGVQPGDTLSGYSAAIYKGDFKHLDEFGRKHGQTVARINDVNRIRAGETLYHIPTYEAFQEIRRRGIADQGEVIMISGVPVHLLGTEAALMRELYNKGAREIQKKALEMLAKGKGEEDVARWVVAQRNHLKVQIRQQGAALFKRIAEMRNQYKYKNPVGPDYDQVVESMLRKGVPRSQIDQKIIRGVTNTSKGFNASGPALRIVGKTAGGVGFILQATQPSPASYEPLPKSEQEQIEIERVRLRYGIPATANIDRHGHLKPDFYMQVDLIDPHAGDEMTAETEEILWWFGVPITYRYQGVTWTVPGRQWWGTKKPEPSQTR